MNCLAMCMKNLIQMFDRILKIIKRLFLLMYLVFHPR